MHKNIWKGWAKSSPFFYDMIKIISLTNMDIEKYPT